MKKRAFTMIELVFSIVIVGLVILSIPLIVRQSNANAVMSQNVLGYYNALTLMDTIRKKPWDTNNIDDFTASGEYYILQTGDKSQCDVLDKTTGKNIKTKKGLGNANRRRMCDPASRSASPITANARLASINDFQGYTTKIVSNGNDIFQLSTNISYANVEFGDGIKTAGSITTTNNTTDVKAINITLTRIDPDNAANNEDIAVYTYYAANIGYDIPFIKDNREVNP